MTRDEIDVVWQQAMHDAIAEGEQMIRYRFAALVAAAEREECAKVCEEWGAWNNVAQDCAAAIRARGEGEK